jgi:hypothetical protein
MKKAPEITIELETPIIRGQTKITSITLRKPQAGELRGVNLMSLAQMDVASLQTVIPRISNPILTTQDVASLEPCELMEIGLEVASFLMKKADRLAVSQAS